jgi:ketosteroid isomerase-like protein
MRTVAAFAALVVASLLPAGAAGSAPSAAMMKPIRTQLLAMNTGNPKLLAGIYAPDATVVDEFAPYTWRGQNAGLQWFTDFGKFAKSAHIADAKGFLMTVRNFDQNGNSAYVVVPATVTGTMAGKKFTEHGTWTFTLVRTGSTWKIVTETWGTVSMTD